MSDAPLPQEERNRIVLGALVAWIGQSSAGVLSRDNAISLLKVLDGIEPPSFIGMGHKVEEADHE